MIEQLTDEQLMRGIQASDLAAFNAFFCRYEKTVFNFSNRKLQDHQLAEEVTSNVFLRIWQKAHQFQFKCLPGSWLYRIMVNETYMAMRSRKRRKCQPFGCINTISRIALKERPDDYVTQSPQFRDVQIRQAVEEIAECISRMAVNNQVAAPLMDEPASEAAALLGISECAFKSKKHRVREHCRKKLPSCWAVRSIYEEW